MRFYSPSLGLSHIRFELLLSVLAAQLNSLLILLTDLKIDVNGKIATKL